MECSLSFESIGREIESHGMQSEIHRHRTGTQGCILVGRGMRTKTKASRVGMELKVAFHYRTFRMMECQQTLAMMKKFSIQELSKNHPYNYINPQKFRSTA